MTYMHSFAMLNFTGVAIDIYDIYVYIGIGLFASREINYHSEEAKPY